MSQDFDPYHRWLGIPPDEQPANHYRLLGLVQLESDVEVIRDAAERQIGHVRTYGLKHPELSQRILNELAAAKACLLDPDRKPQYDALVRKLRGSKPKRGLVRAAGGSATKWIAIGGAGAAGLSLVVSLVLLLVPRGAQSPDREGPAATATESANSEQPEVALAAQEPPTRPQPPKLKTIADRIVEAGKELAVTAELADRGSATGPLRYSLVQGGAPGARMDPETGRFTWTPGSYHASRKHTFTVQVAAEGASLLVDRVTFAVEVRRPVRPPLLYPIFDQRVQAGHKWEFYARASDPNQPPRSLAYSLRDAPDWVQIDEKSGRIVCDPPEEQAAGRYAMLVRVTSSGLEALNDEKAIAIILADPISGRGRKRAKSLVDLPTTSPFGLPMSRRQVHAPVLDLPITSPSGRKLLAADWDVTKKADDAARELRFSDNPKVFPVLDAQDRLLGVCEYNVTAKALHGRVVTFHHGSFARCETYVEYRQGNRHGVLATWDAGGQKEYWGEYERDKRHEFCCLFKDDQPAIVLVCDRGEVKAAHLVSEGKLAKSFTSEEEALGDDNAGPLLKEINDFELRYQKNEVAFKSQVRKTVQSLMGEVNRERRRNMISGINARGAAQKEGARRVQRNAEGQ